MSPGETAAVNQLLGRVVYLHVLFIEPCMTTAASRADLGWSQCCNHSDSACPVQSTWRQVGQTAWSVLLDVAASVPETSTCRPQPDDCCVTCVIGNSAASTAQHWIVTEEEAYHLQGRSLSSLRAWALLAGARLARTFAHQHDLASCARTMNVDNDVAPPTDLPLVGELLALWANPLADKTPVVTWLNHCTGLADVARIIETRRTRV